MADWLALANVAAAEGVAVRPVAWRDGGVVARPRFLDDVARWQAACLQRPGRRVAIHLDDAYDFACALFGAWHAGKTAVLPGDAQPGTLARLLPQVDECIGLLPGALAPAMRGTGVALRPLDPRDCRLVVFTSGSGGDPVGIEKRLDQLDAEVHALQCAFGARIDPNAAVLSTVSHQHIYGLLFQVLWPLAAGRPFAALRFEYPEQVAAAAAGHGPCVLVSSPAQLRRLPASADWRGARATLQAVFSSGGPLPPEGAAASLDRLGHAPIEVFGSSETGGIAWRQHALHGERWTALPGVQWQVDDDRLCVRSPHLPDGAWWPTADRAQALQDGGFVLLGRADRIAKIHEKRVSLCAVERVLQSQPWIAQARALPLSEPGGVRLAVVAVPSDEGWAALARDGRRAFSECLREALAREIDRVALPRRWRYVRALPVNAQGKATEALLAALFRRAMPAPRWLERGPGQARAALQLDEALAVFDGHFTQLPILPGVAQLGWAIELARSCFTMPTRLRRLEQLKFQRTIHPGEHVELELRWDAGGGVLAFRYVGGGALLSGGRAVFGDGDA